MDKRSSETRVSTKNCSLLYTKCFRLNALDLTFENENTAQRLKFEKLVRIRNKRIYIENYCDEPEYKDQIEKNQKRFKTLIRSITIDDDGNRRLNSQLFLPYHEKHENVLQEFKKYKFIDFENLDDRTHIDIYHLDCVAKLRELIWTSQRY